MTKLPKDKKKIDGRYFTLVGQYHYKSDAYVYAKRLRIIGYQARVYRYSKDIYGRQWMVYAR